MPPRQLKIGGIFMKVCFKCNIGKPLSEYYKHSKMKDGHLNKCKECSKKDVQLNYKDNIDYYKDYDKSRLKAPHRVEARKEYAKTENYKTSHSVGVKKYRINNRKISRCHALAQKAVNAGKIEKKSSCEVCGDTKKRLHKHHCDYNKPLEIIFMCPQCHVNWHMENGVGLNVN
jgi:hypothetical protein